jgi:AcrR family transcriptional regulator
VGVTQARPVRRQARGERRIVQILDAALDLFAEVGYEAASTNRIAARAGISPGSLYQFFANKEAIAEALSARLVEEMRVAYAPAFDDHAIATLPIGEMLDRILDPLIEFNVRHPGTKALVGGPEMPPQLAAATQPLQDALNARVVAVIGLRMPGLPAADRDRAAFVVLQIVRAMMPPILAADGAERAALTAELKKALRGYLNPS